MRAASYPRLMGMFGRRAKVPRFDEMPKDNADLAGVAVDFPRLREDSASSAPTAIQNVLDYLALEVPNGDQLTDRDLTFVRTALVADAEYWLWRFREPGPDGQDAFVTVSRRGGGVAVGYDPDHYGLTPEQFILGDYHQVF